MSGGGTMAAVSIRGLDDSVREGLRHRAARHGRSMEAEMRAILTAAVAEEAPRPGLFTVLADRVAQRGGAELDLPRGQPLLAQRNLHHVGTPIDGFDAQIAAICRTRAAVLATRNIKNFLDTGIRAIDPWRDDGGVPDG